jgi:hypothetical protein
MHGQRPTREAFKKLVAQLDRELPSDFRSLPCANGAGGRSLGLAGRSVHDVLSDAVRAVAARRLEVESRRVLRSHGLLALEVEMPGWNIAAASPGADLFFRDAPWGRIERQSLADFVKREDFDDLCTSTDASSLGSPGTPRSIRILHFAKPDLREGPEPWQRAVRRHTAQVRADAKYPGVLSAAGSCSVQYTRAPAMTFRCRKPDPHRHQKPIASVSGAGYLARYATRGSQQRRA